MRLLVLNGPNINLLGSRQPEVYGNKSFEDLQALVSLYAKENHLEIDQIQSNHEGVLIDHLQDAGGMYDGIVFNPAAFTHTSIALFDTLKAIKIPCVEVHISDVDNRESFRKVNYIREACIASITNQGIEGYISAIKLLEERIK